MEDPPLGRIAALVLEFAVKYLPLGRTLIMMMMIFLISSSIITTSIAGSHVIYVGDIPIQIHRVLILRGTARSSENFEKAMTYAPGCPFKTTTPLQ